MKKLEYSDLNGQQLIDIRSQHDYQVTHIKGSLNLNSKNFKKYAMDFLSLDQPVVFIAGEEEQGALEELHGFAEETGFAHIDGYLSAENIPDDAAQKTNTISAKNFLLNEEEDYILLDIRHPDEITRPAPEKNLVNIPLEDLSKDYPSLDNSKTIYTLCGSGNRGTSAASYLSSKGLNAAVVEGGMKAIQESQG